MSDMSVTNVGNNLPVKKNDEYGIQPLNTSPVMLRREPEIDTFFKNLEKERKRQKYMDIGSKIGAVIGSLASVGFLVYVFMLFKKGGFNPADFKKENLRFVNYSNDKTIGDLATTKTFSDKVRENLQNFVKAAKGVSDAVANFTGKADKTGSQRCAILYGPSGTGKTESVKMLAKSTNSELAIIKVADYANSYLNGTAGALSKMFEEIEKILKANPNKNYMILFDEGDAIVRKFENISARENHLAQDRQSFLTGFDKIKQYKNVRLFLATNASLEQLDTAARSRFGQSLKYELPKADELKAGLEHLIKNITTKEEIRNGLLNDSKLDEFLGKLAEDKYAYRDLDSLLNLAFDRYSLKLSELEKQGKPQSDWPIFGVKDLQEAMEALGKTANSDKPGSDIMQLLQ